MNGLSKQSSSGAAGETAPDKGLEFVVDGATVSVAFSGQDAARDPGPALEKAKRAIARLASLQEAEMARQGQAREKRPGVRDMPNVFEFWAYRRD